MAGLDPYQKLNTRGEVWEVYWIQPLVQPILQCRFGYQKVERDYTSTLFGGLYGAPEEIDQEIARFKLASMGIDIDVLTAEQEAYLDSWQEGT